MNVEPSNLITIAAAHIKTQDAMVHLNKLRPKACPVQNRSHTVKPIAMNRGAKRAANVPYITDIGANGASVRLTSSGNSTKPLRPVQSPTPLHNCLNNRAVTTLVGELLSRNS